MQAPQKPPSLEWVIKGGGAVTDERGGALAMY